MKSEKRSKNELGNKHCASRDQGISFMNRTEKTKISEEIKSDFLTKSVERNLSHDEEDEISAICQKLRASQESATQKRSFDISNFSLNAICILHQEIKSRFPQIGRAHV